MGISALLLLFLCRTQRKTERASLISREHCAVKIKKKNKGVIKITELLGIF